MTAGAGVVAPLTDWIMLSDIIATTRFPEWPNKRMNLLHLLVDPYRSASIRFALMKLIVATLHHALETLHESEQDYLADIISSRPGLNFDSKTNNNIYP